MVRAGSSLPAEAAAAKGRAAVRWGSLYEPSSVGHVRDAGETPAGTRRAHPAASWGCPSRSCTGTGASWHCWGQHPQPSGFLLGRRGVRKRAAQRWAAPAGPPRCLKSTLCHVEPPFPAHPGRFAQTEHCVPPCLGAARGHRPQRAGPEGRGAPGCPSRCHGACPPPKGTAAQSSPSPRCSFRARPQRHAAMVSAADVTEGTPGSCWAPGAAPPRVFRDPVLRDPLAPSLRAARAQGARCGGAQPHRLQLAQRRVVQKHRGFVPAPGESHLCRQPGRGSAPHLAWQHGEGMQKGQACCPLGKPSFSLFFFPHNLLPKLLGTR